MCRCCWRDSQPLTLLQMAALGPKNNLSEQLALYGTASTTKKKNTSDKSLGVGKYFTNFQKSDHSAGPSKFTTPHKPSLSFSKPGSGANSNPTPFRGVSHSDISHVQSPAGYGAGRYLASGPSKPPPTTPGQSKSFTGQNKSYTAPPGQSKSFTGQNKSYTAPPGQSKSYTAPNNSLSTPDQNNSFSPDKSKPHTPQSFTAPVVSKATQSCEAKTDYEGPLTSISQVAKVPGSSLAFCRLPGPLDTRKESPSDSKSAVQLELEGIRSEMMSVMSDICERLAAIPSSDITGLFGTSAWQVQEKLAKRKRLLLKEESLKRCMEASPVSLSDVSSSPVSSPGPSPLTPLTHFTKTTPSFLDKPMEHRTHSPHHPKSSETPASVPVLDEMEWDIGVLEDMECDMDRENLPPNTPPFPSSKFPPAISADGAGGKLLSNSHEESSVRKNSFRPPFLQSGSGTLNSSFGVTSAAKPNMFKPSANRQAPRDDASEFRGQYQHAREMYKIFNQVFGLKRFRPNQLEAVNATVLGEDCFVLMPTGGGKSLCYQLPALITAGVTVVVSPLRSLIQDQVQKLHSLGIPASHLSGELSAHEEGQVYGCLVLREPVIKLLYVTPEKLGASNKLLSTLQGLHNRKMLARFVIDEAHCISQWGHDFRPDYKKLSELRHKFSGVPIMALTATATPRVRADILYQLKMQKTCKWFTQSFNRTNLKYVVVPKKPKKAIQDIIELILKSFSGLSGIIYCLSRRDCEVMAGRLCEGGIAALCYHAGLTNDERCTVQQRWVQEDRCKVVCATIAFGMGIDKPDVRFVIHHSLPKSVEGYYQEAGRAGRDGAPAQCVLFYNYSDMARLRRMVKAEKLLYEQEKVHMDNLYRMVQYCENMADCRRVQLLEYFAESFDSNLCKNGSTPCDNCQSSVPFIAEDVTSLVKVIVESVQEVGRDKYTLNQYLDALKGSGGSRIANGELATLPLYKRGSGRTKHDLERLLHMLVMQDVLSESLTIGFHDNVVCYVKMGGKGRDVLSGKVTGIILKVKGTGTTSTSSKTAPQAMSREEVLKTECLKALHALRLSVTTRLKLQNPEYILPSASLKAMSEQLPTTKQDMLNVEGYTEIKWNLFEGQEFLKVTKEYAEEMVKLHEHGLGSGAEDHQSAYFKGTTKEKENRPRPVLGKGKRKKVGTGGDKGDPAQHKKPALLQYTNEACSEDEFEAPSKVLHPIPHPNKKDCIIVS